MRKKRGIIIFIAAAVLLCGCGLKVSNKTPESVAKSLITAYQEQDEKAVKKCFGLDTAKACPEEIQGEIDYNMKYYEVHEAETIGFEKAGSLGESDKKELVYVWYYYEIKGTKETQRVPALSFYFVQKKDKKYYVVPARDVTEKMSDISKEKYNEFIKTEVYKKYDKAYQAFTRKNPRYENTLQNNFKEKQK